MSSKLLQPSRRSLRMLIIATALILSTLYGTIVLDKLVGTGLTPQAYACQPSGGSCG